MTWTKEQKKAASDRMKELHRKKKLEREQATDEVPTMAEAQVEVDEANIASHGLDAEPQTVDEIDEKVTMPKPDDLPDLVITAPITGERVTLPADTPIRVTYVALNRNFGITLPDPRRGKKLIDGTVVSDKTITFFHHRYETKSLEERVGIETSNSFLNNRVDIFPKGVSRLFPDMKRETRKLPNERRFMQIMGINERTPADEQNMASMRDPWA